MKWLVWWMILICIFTLSACGHRNGPTGGPTDTEAPTILSITPGPFEEIGDITVTFSKPIDRSTILSGIYTYPPITGKKYTWKDQTTLVIHFTENFAPDTNYFITFSDAIQCTHGNPLVQTTTYTFKHGTLQDGRVSGNIEIGRGLNAGNPIRVSLWSADSVRVFDTILHPGPFVFENLNRESYYMDGWIDENTNDKYDYGIDGYARTPVHEAGSGPLALTIAVQDTIPPKMIKIIPKYDNLVEVSFKEPPTRIDSVSIHTADSLYTRLPVHTFTLSDNALSVLTGKQDTLHYSLRVFGAEDARGNRSRVDSLVFQAKAEIDSLPPTFEASWPRNGATVSNLRPEIRLLFSEVVPSGHLEVAMNGVERGNPVPLEVISADATVCVVRPKEDLDNYTTYRVLVGRATTDTNGNALPEPVEFKFITVEGISGAK
jgi:hypothetical protein